MDSAWAATLLTVVLVAVGAGLRLLHVRLVAESALRGSNEDVSALRIRARPKKGGSGVVPPPRAPRARAPRAPRAIPSFTTHELLGLLLALGYGDGQADGHLDANRG